MEIIWGLSVFTSIAGVFGFKYLLWWMWDLPSYVECWFCRKSTKIRQSKLNAWFCPSCEQYNGFAKDGGYNRSLPRLFDEKLNRCESLVGRCKNNWRRIRALCRDCNRLQEVKLKQLSEFVPMNPKNFDKEIEHFSKELDKVFVLCSKCDGLLRLVLQNERIKFRLPKRLEAEFHKAIEGGKTSFLVITLSLAVCLLALQRLKVVSLPVPWSTLQVASPIVDTLRDEIKRAPHLVDFTVLAAGLVANCFWLLQTRSWIVRLNFLCWMTSCGLLVYLNDREFTSNVQVIMGAASILLSILVHVEYKLRSQGKKRRQLSYRSSSSDFDFRHSPNGESMTKENLKKTQPASPVNDRSTAHQPDDSNLRRLQHLRLGSPCRSKVSARNSTKRSFLSSDESNNWWDGLDSSSSVSWSRRNVWANSVVSPPKFVFQTKASRASTEYNFDRRSESPPDLDNISSWSAPTVYPTQSFYRPRSPSPPSTQPQAQCYCSIAQCHLPAMYCSHSTFSASTPIADPISDEPVSNLNFFTFLQGAFYVSVVGLLCFNVYLLWIIQSLPGGTRFLTAN